MKIQFYAIVGLISVGLAVSQPAQAQSRKQLIKQLERSLARQTFTPSKSVYHPVFGYVYAQSVPVLGHNSSLVPALGGGLVTPFLEAHSVQVAPIKSPLMKGQVAQEFVPFDFLLPNQLAQAFYLWRLGHSQAEALPNTDYQAFIDRAQEVYDYHISYQTYYGGMNEVVELPNLLFLKRLADPAFIPFSYAGLVSLVDEYPKHVTLGSHGFPVHTPQADFADLLDIYLLLSNPQEMGAFNNAGFYTPFTLTPQEHEAAGNLLALYKHRACVPAQPTVRQVIEIAYNRLETHTVKYSQIKNAGLSYQAYPNYKNTQLYRTIKGMLKNQTPHILRESDGKQTLGNEDITHLIVLDAVMGGVNTEDLFEVIRAFEAFEALCGAIHPLEKTAIAHARILQQNLRTVFYRFLQPSATGSEAEASSSPWSEWEENMVRRKARQLFQRDIVHLIGVQWK